MKGYELVFHDDEKRDGRYAELIDTVTEDEVAEVFLSNVDGTMAISIFCGELPLEAVEYLIVEAKRDLPRQPAKVS